MRGALVRGALLAALLTGCGHDADAPTQSGAEAAAAGPVPADSAIAPAPDAAIMKAPTNRELSKLCPLGDGTTIDSLHRLLERGEFAEVDAVFRRTHEAYRQTSACEFYVRNTVEALRNFDFALLDRWVAARPESWAALTTRASKWVNTGYQRRGGRLAKDVTQEQWAGMRDAFARAGRDLQRAVEIEPNGFMAYADAIRLLQASGGEPEWRPWLDALLARDPANFEVRWAALDALVPNWGGSLAAMRELAEDAQRFADRNPKLRKLLGRADVEQGHAYRLAGRYAEAAVLFRRALAHGDDHIWYDELAKCLEAMGQWKEVLEVSDSWIAALDQAIAYVWRGRALLELGRPAEALASYDVAIQYSPDYAYALRLRASALKRSGRLAEASSDLHHALALEYDAWAVNELAEIATEDPTSTPHSVSLARTLIDKHPNDPAPWFLLGSALHASGAAEARAALDRYVALAQASGDEWARLAKARRMLNPPPPGGRPLPALAYLGLARAKPQ